MDSVVSICPSCSTKNKVPARHLSHTGRCGKCKASLPPVSEPVEADESLFDAVVSQAQVPVLVDFWAAWCGPCRMAAPEVHKLAQEIQGKGVVLKVDTDANPHLAARFAIQSIPNFVVFRGGKAVFQRAGVAGHSEMKRWLDAPG